MNFFKTLLAVLVGLFLFSFLGVILFIGIIGASTAEPEVAVSANTVLHLNLDRPIEDRGYNDPLGDLPGITMPSNSYGLIRMKEVLRKAASDERVKGIYLESPMIMAGFAITDELREALSEFKESGKFIIAHAELYTEQGYYLASVADEVYTTETSAIEFNGLAAELIFFKGTLDKLGVEPQVFRVGDFKSAVEPFTRKDMSPENEQQMMELVTGVYDIVLDRISESRGLDREELARISSKMEVTGPESALKHNLIDGIVYYDEVMSKMKGRIGIDEDDDLKMISYAKYEKAAGTEGSGNESSHYSADLSKDSGNCFFNERFAATYLRLR